MSETEVTTALTAALEVRTSFYQDSAKQYQTIILARLEEAYRDARNFAYGTPKEDGTESEPSIHWFRVMLGVLQDIQALLKGHMDSNKPAGLTLINQTILMGDDMFEKGKSLRPWKDMNIQDLIDGQVIDE